MKSKLKNHGLEGMVCCDSAGILGIHSGEPADVRMRKHSLARGYKLTSLSRKINPKFDFDNFDLIIAMDDQNIKDLNTLARSEEDKKIFYRMTDFSKQKVYNYIPDPYYSGNEGFELVLDLLEDSCDGLILYLSQGTANQNLRW
jgi:protein-tyrosine phosphatase